ENTILSPYSIAAALTMTYGGARGATADEMRRTLHLGVSDERIHAARNELDLRITAEVPPVEGDDRTPLAIRVANSLWGQAGYPFREEFLELLAANYDAGMNLADFVAAAEEARLAINTWVEGETEGRIVDLIPEGVITELTRLVLVNAIWFKANWAQPFDPEATSPGPFTLLDGSEVTADLMHGSFLLPYAEGDGYQAVRIPYAGDAAMLLVLPAEDRFEEVRASLDGGTLDEISSAAGDRQVELTLPKFEFRCDESLSAVLQAMGMPAAFTDPSLPGGADFTGITERRELMIQDVIHQAFIAVDEEGTEAAAATAVVIGLTSAPEPAEMVVDRPFLCAIEHSSTGEILFLGQVIDPS
ncbi:MAG: serpin family protein, partial [Actinobacteria bacterium]